MIDPSSHRADLTLTTFSPRPEPRASGSVKKPTGPQIIKLARENIAPGGAIRDPRGLGIHFRTPRKGSFCGRAGFFTDPSASGHCCERVTLADARGSVRGARGCA